MRMLVLEDAMRLVSCVILALVSAGCADPAAGPSPATADGAGPAWSFAATDGNTYSRDAPPANATVLFFMASWCSSCRAKAPVVATVHDEYVDRGVRTLSVDFDPSETASDIAAWQERYDQDWPHGIDEGRAVQRALGVTTQSTVLVLDSDGRIVKHFGYGQVTQDGLREAIETALAA